MKRPGKRARPQGAKHSKSGRTPQQRRTIQPRFRILVDGQIALGPGKAELLQQVLDTGSIAEAAKRMGMSYMRAWMLIRTMNSCFKQPVVNATRGGRTKGGAEVTETGLLLLKYYHRLQDKSLKAASSEWRALSDLLK